MKDASSVEKATATLQLTVEELKKALRDVVFEAAKEKSAILGAPRQDREWPEIFVLMPFSATLKPVYEDHIRRVARQVKLRAGRADDFFTTAALMADIWSAINAARIILADCTGRNPNVMYEIGLAHAIGRDTILISQTIDDVPVDLRHLRVILYEYTPRGMKELEKSLRATIMNSSPPPSYICKK